VSNDILYIVIFLQSSVSAVAKLSLTNSWDRNETYGWCSENYTCHKCMAGIVCKCKCINNYSAPIRERSIVNLWWPCMSVCLSVCKHIPGTARPIFTKFLCMLPMALALFWLRHHLVGITQQWETYKRRLLMSSMGATAPIEMGSMGAVHPENWPNRNSHNGRWISELKGLGPGQRRNILHAAGFCHDDFGVKERQIVSFKMSFVFAYLLSINNAE